MKIKLYCDNNANIYSKREEEFDVEDLGYSEDEWLALSEDEKQKVANEWADEFLEIGFEEN